MPSDPDWKIAEDKVVRATGGKPTPGSGNKSVKGDVRISKTGWMLEVKQTSKDTLTIKRLWLDKLERHRNNSDLCLVLFFELRGTPYYFSPQKHQEATDWKSLSVTEENLPEVLYTINGIWERDTWDSLYDLDG